MSCPKTGLAYFLVKMKAQLFTEYSNTSLFKILQADWIMLDEIIPEHSPHMRSFQSHLPSWVC